MSRAPDLTPEEARDRWLSKRKPDVSESTLSSLHYRLKLFTDWCAANEIDTMSELTAWDLDEYGVARREKAVAITLNKELGTLKRFLDYCATLGILDENLPKAVTPPEVSKDEMSDDTKLEPEAGEALLAYFRESDERATRPHVMLELFWTIGCRVGALRGLDVRDVDVDKQFVAFRHRPETGTPLKNGTHSERLVGLLDETADVLEEWLSGQRMDVHDDNGRQPLLPSVQGRPVPGTIRDWCYLATVPCQYQSCPHEKDPESCDWLSYVTASKCPSSRAPHQVRTGSITWQRSRGIPEETVSDRVDSGVEMIRKHYDKETERRELEERRREYLGNLELGNNDK